VAVARSYASRRNSSWLLPTRWLLPCACLGPDARVPAAAQRVAAWSALGWWILKTNTLLAAAPLFFKLKIIISFNIQKSKFYPPYDYISFSFFFVFFFFWLFICSVFYFLLYSS